VKPAPLPSTGANGAWPALRHRDYRIFWVGDGLSSIGTQFTTVAMAWQIYELTDSPLQIGLLGLAQAVPQIALLLVGGLLADAVDRRKLMLATQLVQGGVSALLLTVTVLGIMSPPFLYLASALIGVANALDNPARQALVPNLVARTELTNALALTNAQRRFAQIAGPALAGVALASAGPALCYGVDTVSWSAMLGALLMIRTQPRAGGRPMISARSVAEGFRFVWAHPVILTMMALDFGMNFFGSPQALLPIYARDVLVVGPQGLGMLYAATAAGSLAAAVCLSLRGTVRRAGLMVLLGVTIYGAATVVFALSSTFGLSLLMLAGAGVGNTIGAILRQTINQLSVPDALRGRVTAVNSMFTTGGPRLGQFESGLTATWWGAEASALVGGLATVALAVAVLLPGSVRNLEIVGGRPVDRRDGQPPAAPATQAGEAPLVRSDARSAPESDP
jgi:MFS family permease